MEEKIELIKNRANKIFATKNLDMIENRIKDLTAISNEPDFWKSNPNAQNLMQELGDLQYEVEKLKIVKQEVEDITTFVELKNQGEEVDADLENAIKTADKTLDAIELETYLGGKFDKNNAVLSIHAGQGGTEACDWAEMLMRMYLRFFEKQGWKVEIIHKVEGEEAGIKSVTFEVIGKYTYGYLKGEHGTHRLVRVSPFNAQGLRQTSFAGVEVTPLIEDDVEVDLNEEDIEFSAVRSSGPGGQNVNKTSSSVRLTHIPTGITVYSSNQRGQLQNRKIAMALLRSKLFQIQKAEHEKELSSEKGEHKIAGWGNQIRNYVLHPYRLVKDLRTGIETDRTDNVLDGDIIAFVEAGIKI